MKSNDNKKTLNRRDFLKRLGIGATATTAAVLTGCNNKNNPASKGSVATGEIPTDMMEYRTNPTSGDKVSLLGYGCMRWPLRQKSDGSGEEIDQEAVNELVDYAIAHGVNYFDTSPRYVRGMSEEATGIALKRHPRDKFFIATKLSTQADNPELRTREGSIAMYKESLKRLQVDYIDYYLIHATGLGKAVLTPSTDEGSMDAIRERIIDNGMLEFLKKEKEAGRIRNLGWSWHGDINVFNYLLELHDRGEVAWDFVQIQLNYVDWRHASGWNTNAEYLYGELEKRNIPAVVMEPLLGGRLSNINDFLVAKLKQQEPEKSVASWAFRFAGSHPGVLTVLSGMVYMEHLKDNLRTYAPFKPLTDAEKDLLEEVAQVMLRYPSVPCTNCQYCMPCPYGINIPAIFAHYNKCINDGNVPESAKDANYNKARKAFLVGYDRSVPKLRQANHCIGCNQCAPHCPQSIKIPDELHRIDNFVEQLKQGILE